VIRLDVAVPLPQASLPVWNKRLWLVANADLLAARIFPEAVPVGRWEFTAGEGCPARPCPCGGPHQHFVAEARGLFTGRPPAVELATVAAGQPGDALAAVLVIRRGGPAGWLRHRLADLLAAFKLHWTVPGVVATYRDSAGRTLCPDCEQWTWGPVGTCKG
jgi:hypothetical protein